MSPDSDAARLREELDLSRRELAAVRARLEEALEELAVERSRHVVDQAVAPAVVDAGARPPVLGRLADRLRRQAT